MLMLIIGNYGESYWTDSLAQSFEHKGHQVIRIATDEETHIYGEDPKAGHHDIHVLDEIVRHWEQRRNRKTGYNEAYRVRLNHRRLRLSWLLSFPAWKDKVIDRILIVQSRFLWRNDTTIPTDFYATEILKIQLPQGPIANFFYAYEDAEAKYNNQFPIEFVLIPHKQFIPYGFEPALVPPSVIKPFMQRTVKIGFMGQWGLGSKDPYVTNFYNGRADTLNYLKEEFGAIVKSRCPFKDYLAFMGNTQIAPNIPGQEGNWNQRQYEVLACGCVLLQYHFPTLDAWGFEDRKNCLLFESSDDIKTQLEWADQHPIELAQIAANGLAFITKTKQWDQRVTLMLDTMALPNDEELEKFRKEYHRTTTESKVYAHDDC